MYCNLYVKNNKAYKQEKTLSYYSQGYKLCKECELFLDWNGIRCPCCNAVLGLQPHNSMILTITSLNQSVSMVLFFSFHK